VGSFTTVHLQCFETGLENFMVYSFTLTVAGVDLLVLEIDSVDAFGEAIYKGQDMLDIPTGE
jgi:hypothetical protein